MNGAGPCVQELLQASQQRAAPDPAGFEFVALLEPHARRNQTDGPAARLDDRTHSGHSNTCLAHADLVRDDHVAGRKAARDGPQAPA